MPLKATFGEGFVPGLSCGVWSPLSPGLRQAGGPRGLVFTSPPHRPQCRFPFASVPGISTGAAEDAHTGRGGCAGLCPPGCPPLPRQSRATTSSARVLAVNEMTATAWPLCRRRRSGQHPVSTWIHGNVALISMAGGWLGRRCISLESPELFQRPSFALELGNPEGFWKTDSSPASQPGFG